MEDFLKSYSLPLFNEVSGKWEVSITDENDKLKLPIIKTFDTEKLASDWTRKEVLGF